MLNINDFLNHPMVNKNEWDLVIFTYSRECQFDRKWDDVTSVARGIIFNKVTGELVARPFKRFFNLGEMPETSFGNLPDEPFTATVKLDGSLGISFPYKGQYWVATKGSFHSDQAMWATSWMRKNIRTSEYRKGYTYLYEIIYKENKIVVSYGDYEGLTLLAVIDNETGKEIPYQELVIEADRIGAVVVKQETGFTKIEDLYEYCKGLPATQEGFVVTFASGLKIKMKGADYVRIHKMVSNMTPLAFWEAWDIDLKDIPKDYLAQLPEEFRDVSDALYQQIYSMHWGLLNRISQLHAELEVLLGKDADKKTWALRVKELYPKEFSGIMDFHNGKIHQMLRGIHRQCRPTQNVLPKGLAGADRIQRVLQDL